MEKSYETENLKIFWKPDICQHAGKCVHGAPKVFEVGRKPWIIPENGREEDIIKVIIIYINHASCRKEWCDYI